MDGGDRGRGEPPDLGLRGHRRDDGDRRGPRRSGRRVRLRGADLPGQRHRPAVGIGGGRRERWLRCLAGRRRRRQPPPLLPERRRAGSARPLGRWRGMGDLPGRGGPPRWRDVDRRGRRRDPLRRLAAGKWGGARFERGRRVRPGRCAGHRRRGSAPGRRGSGQCPHGGVVHGRGDGREAVDPRDRGPAVGRAPRRGRPADHGAHRRRQRRTPAVRALRPRARRHRQGHLLRHRLPGRPGRRGVRHRLRQPGQRPPQRGYLHRAGWGAALPGRGVPRPGAADVRRGSAGGGSVLLPVRRPPQHERHLRLGLTTPTYNGDMGTQRPDPATVPDQPGAYLFRDADARVIYVGKAKSLRKRLPAYWSAPLHPRTETMMEQADRVEWIVASGEVDALLLEYNLIQEHRPRPGGPCLYYDIGRCAGPCVPERTGVTEQGYAEIVGNLVDFMAGNQQRFVRELERDMRAASEAQEYEKAARARDRLRAARKALEAQEMVLPRSENLDVVGMAEDDLEAAFQVFFVRRGRVTGRKGWVVDRVEDLDTPHLVASFVRELYMERDEVPPRVLVPAWPVDGGVLEAWLADRRSGRVRIAVPARGDKRRLLQVVTTNAKESFVRHKMKRASDFAARSRALGELGEALGLQDPPL